MTMRVAIIYRKVDGIILRASSIPSRLAGKITEDDIQVYMPGADNIDEYAMVFVQGKQYLDIGEYKVQVDTNGEFMGIVER